MVMPQADAINDLLVKGQERQDDYREFYDITKRLIVDEALDLKSDVPFKAIDISLTGDGGYVFQWKDVLDWNDLLHLDDILKALIEGRAAEALFINELAKVAVSLLKAWSKMRRIRVAVNENEFKVILAIRRGNQAIPAIVTFAELPEATVSDVISGLKDKMYNETISLIEDKDGLLTTPF